MDETYIAVMNDSRSVLKKGSQAWYFYGGRSNFFLLANYGFCFKDNNHDSVKCRMKLDENDLGANLSGSMPLSEMVDFDLVQSPEQQADPSTAYQVISFKRHQLNEILMSYIRVGATELGLQPKQPPTAGGAPQNGAWEDVASDILLTKVVDLEIEEKCLERYQEIVKFIVSELESQTTLEEDLAILDQHQAKSPQNGRKGTKTGARHLSQNMYFAVLYRSEMKKTMRAQLELVNFVEKVVQHSYQVKAMTKAGSSKTAASKAFKAIYLEKLPSEIDQCHENGEFLDEKDEFWF